MAGLIDNKDRIINTFDGIRLSIINKGVTPIDDITTYSQSILDIPQEWSGASSLKVSNMGSYYWVPTGNSEQYKAFTLSTYGRRNFINSGTITKCTVEGTYFVTIGSCLIGNTNSQAITQVKRSDGTILAEAIGDNGAVNANVIKFSLFVNDEITIYSTYLGDTPIKRYHLINLYELLQ